jgi:hypothetical protein
LFHHFLTATDLLAAKDIDVGSLVRPHELCAGRSTHPLARGQLLLHFALFPLFFLGDARNLLETLLTLAFNVELQLRFARVQNPNLLAVHGLLGPLGLLLLHLLAEGAGWVLVL